jgi:hypothetical protein
MSIKRLSGAGLTTPKTNKLWDQTTFQSGMFALATISLTTTSSSLVFSSIPNTYTHLQLRCFLRCDRADTADAPILRFNGDTGSNYAYFILRGDGSSPGSSSAASQTSILTTFEVPAASATAGIFGGMVIDIQDYANTTKYKTVRTLSGRDTNNVAGGAAAMNSGLWFKAGSGVTSDAITSITLTPNYGANFVAGSHIALYGIKGA